MFPAYAGNGNKPSNSKAPPPMTEDERTTLAVQTVARKTFDTDIVGGSQIRDDSVFQQGGYGASDSEEDNGGCRIVGDSEPVEDDVFILPETLRIEAIKQSKKVQETYRRYGKNSQIMDSHGNMRLNTYPPGPHGTSRSYDDQQSTSGGNKRRRSRSRDSSRYSRHSRSRSHRRDDSRDRSRKKKKKSRKRSSSESSEDSGRKSRSSNPSSSRSIAKQPKYVLLKEKEEITEYGDYIISSRKFDSENYILGCPRSEVAKMKLKMFCIVGLEYQKELFRLLYGEEMKRQKEEQRTFYEKLASIDRRSKEENAKKETYFRKRPPVDGYWKLIHKADIINGLPGSGGDKTTEDSLTNESEIGNELTAIRRKVRECPTDVQSVLKLLDMEEEAARLNIGSFVAIDARAVAERHEEILRKAIQFNPRNAALQIRLCEVIYVRAEDKQQTMTDFRAVCSKFPQEPMTWIKQQNFIQFDSNVYTSEVMKSAFDNCLEKAHNMLARIMVSHMITDLPAFKSFYLSTYIRFLKWNLSKGITPVALACIQATMELNFGLPEARFRVLRDRYEALNTFWDTGAPRIGDELATGASAWMELNWSDDYEHKCENKDFAKLITGTKEAISNLLERKEVLGNNWVDFERYLCDVDARVKRSDFEQSKLYESVRDDFAGISFHDPVEFAEVENARKERVVIPFYPSESQANFNFVQPLLELLGIKFMNTTDIYTTSEQVISEWIPHNIFVNYRPNFEKIPTYCEKTCSDVGMRILKFLIKQRHQICQKEVNVLDEQLMKLTFAQIETDVANIEKDLVFYRLKKKDIVNLLNETLRKDLKPLIDRYPAFQKMVGFVIAERIVQWIKNGIEERWELEKLDRMRENLEEKECDVLNDHVVTQRDRENSEEVMKFFANYMGKLDKTVEGDKESHQFLYEISIPFNNLQLRIYSLIIKSGLYFYDEKSQLEVRSMFLKALVDESEDLLEGLTANKSLWDPVDAALKHLIDVVKGREVHEGVSRYTEMPRATALCEALQIAASFVFLDQNARPLLTMNEMTKDILHKIDVFNEKQMNFTRTTEDKAHDRIDLKYILNVTLEFFAHKNLTIDYCLNYEKIVRAAADTFPCNSKFTKKMAELYSNNRLQWMKLCGILKERNKIIREKQDVQFDEQHERCLLQNSLAMMYATKRICHKMGGDSKRMLYRHFLNEAKQIRDPAVWRMVFKPAVALSVRVLSEEAYIAAYAQCPWAIHIHIDYLERRADDLEYEKWKEIWGKTLLAMSSQYHKGYGRTMFIDDPDVLDAHVSIREGRGEPS